MVHTAYTTCPLCEATCGLELTLDGGAVTGVRGDTADARSRQRDQLGEGAPGGA